jgi:hypothetical protein
MSVNLSPIAGAAGQFFTDNGIPLAGGKLYTYTAGTTTPKTTFTSSAGAVVHPNPIILNSAGRVPDGEIWVTNDAAYKFVLTTAEDTLIGTWDNITNFIFSANAQDVVYDPPYTGGVQTNVEAKLAQILTVTDFGATGDGVADDSTAINAALSYANAIGGATVLVPPGNYKLNAILRIGSNTTLKSNNGVSYLKNHPNTFLNNGLGYTTSSNIPAYSGHKNIVIDGGVWEGFAFEIFDGYTGFALGYGTNIVLKNIILKDSIGTGHAVDMAACDGVLFENCRFLGYSPGAGTNTSIQDCIQLDHNVEGSFPYFGVPAFKQNLNITVRGCYFGPNPDNTDVRFRAFSIGVGQHGSVYDQWPENILVENNTFEGCIYAGVRVWKWRNAKILGNTFVDCARPVHVTATAANSVSSRDINRVQQDQAEASEGLIISGNNFRNSSDYHIFISNIQFGSDTSIRHKNIVIANNIGETTATDFVTVRNCENFIVANNISKNARRFVFQGNGNSENISIIGNTLINHSPGSGAFGVLYFVGNNANRVTISNNIFENVTTGRGIHISQGGSNGTITGNVFSNVAGFAARLQDNSNIWNISGNTFVSTNLTQDQTNTAPIAVTSTCLGVVVTGNNNAASNITAPQPVYLESAGGGYADVQYAGTPEGDITAPIGSICRNTSGGAGTSIYIKESGNGLNTGWVGK